MTCPWNQYKAKFLYRQDSILWSAPAPYCCLLLLLLLLHTVFCSYSILLSAPTRYCCLLLLHAVICSYSILSSAPTPYCRLLLLHTVICSYSILSSAPTPCCRLLLHHTVLCPYSILSSAPTPYCRLLLLHIVVCSSLFFLYLNALYLQTDSGYSMKTLDVRLIMLNMGDNSCILPIICWKQYMIFLCPHSEEDGIKVWPCLSIHMSEIFYFVTKVEEWKHLGPMDKFLVGHRFCHVTESILFLHTLLKLLSVSFSCLSHHLQ